MSAVQGQKDADKIVFVCGMRRSGTSILRTIVQASSDVDELLFEPHELWMALAVVHLARYSAHPVIRDILDHWLAGGRSSGRWFGAKWGLNVGMWAMHWREIDANLGRRARWVFIERDTRDVFASWSLLDQDSHAGTCAWDLFRPFAEHIAASFRAFCQAYPQRGVLLSYEQLVQYPAETMEPVWSMLNAKNLPDPTLRALVHRPQQTRGLGYQEPHR